VLIITTSIRSAAFTQTMKEKLFEFILIRHGSTIFNQEGRFQGGQDSPLNEKGKSDSVLLGNYLNRTLSEVDYWFSSPLGRARETSRLLRDNMIAHMLPNEKISDELREISCGEFEGQLRSHVDQDLYERIKSDVYCSYPGGESRIDVINRCRKFVEFFFNKVEIQNSYFRTIIVSHGNFIQCLTVVLAGLGNEFTIRSSATNTGFARLVSKKRDLPYRIETWNETPHLI